MPCLYGCGGEGKTKYDIKKMYGTYKAVKDGCGCHFTLSKPGCAEGSDVCVCMYCCGCPFFGWHMSPCFTSDKGDCYCGCSGSSLFVLTVKDEETIWPNDCQCDEHKKVVEEAGTTEGAPPGDIEMAR